MLADRTIHLDTLDFSPVHKGCYARHHSTCLPSSAASTKALMRSKEARRWPFARAARVGSLKAGRSFLKKRSVACIDMEDMEQCTHVAATQHDSMLQMLLNTSMSTIHKGMLQTYSQCAKSCCSSLRQALVRVSIWPGHGLPWLTIYLTSAWPESALAADHKETQRSPA